MRTPLVFATVLAFLLNPTSLISKMSDTDEGDVKLVFCYFNNVKISPSQFSVLCYANSADGVDYLNEGICTKAPQSTHDAGDFENRLWFFSIPTSAYAAAFKVMFLEDGSFWSSTLFQKITGPLFIYNLESDYSTLGHNSTWGDVHVSYRDFALYVLSWIDPDSPSAINGYNSFPQIDDGIYSRINDSADPEEVCWDDAYVGPTSVQKKWELIQSNYKKANNSKNSEAIQIICGSIMLFASLALLSLPLIRFLKRGQKL